MKNPHPSQTQARMGHPAEKSRSLDFARDDSFNLEDRTGEDARRSTNSNWDALSS